MSSVTEQIDSKKKQLLKVADPTQVMAGSIEVDAEMHKLAHNLKVLVNLIYLAGSEATRLKQDYHKARFDMMTTVTAADLEALGIVKSQKDQYCKLATADQLAAWELRENQRRYFENTYTSYQETLWLYKKTRLKNDEMS